MGTNEHANANKRGAAALEKEAPVKIARGANVSVHPFFTSPQASQSKKFNISWHGSNDSILTAVTCEPGEARTKIAAFDLDGTLILTASGRAFAKDENDWKWFHTSVPKKLESLHNEGYAVTILSNQNGLKSPAKVESFKRKIANILSQLSIPIRLIAAMKKDIYRKPATGMWDLLQKEINGKIDLGESFYIGDAAGRAEGWKHKAKKDHSCGDRKFADNISIEFHTPEEYFLKEAPNKFSWGGFDPKKTPTEGPLFSPSDTPLIPEGEGQEVIVFVGYPASGKSTFAHKHLVPNGYVYVNQDTLKTRDNCIAACKAALREGKSVVIDNTNANKETREYYVKAAKSSNVKIRCFWFTAPKELAQHNNIYRAYHASDRGRELLPGMVFDSFSKKFQEPMLSEGFEEIKKINFVLDGSEVERKKWQQWWS
ncbi:polynucleotide kinase 3 phosphatase-domain-containing protein [Umbelopsis sp. PMI_123]|nr:polynucleotide kinase 3 phosphatase-domain-containing protein [Umbelopsis sp. PMI_123]